jgi:hypothetical protein
MERQSLVLLLARGAWGVHGRHAACGMRHRRWAGGGRPGGPGGRVDAGINCRQDPMATPGNFGEGGHRPGPDFSGHNEGANNQQVRRGEGAPRARVRRNPNPQTTEHERGTSAARSRGFLFSKAIRGPAGLQRLCPVSVSQLRI